MNDQPAPELGLEPGGFGWHDVPAVGDVHELFHSDGIQRECDLHFATINSALKFLQSADTSNKVYPLVCTEVVNIQQRLEYLFREDGDVEDTDGIGIVVSPGFCHKQVPFAFQIHCEFMKTRRTDGVGSRRANRKRFLE